MTAQRQPATGPFRPASPLPPYFDSIRKAWIFSRYSDVFSALREPALLQATSHNEAIPGDSAEHHAQMFTAVRADIARLTTIEWRTTMKHTLRELLAAHGSSPFDLVRQVIHPWSIAMLLHLTGANPQQARKLSGIATRMVAASSQVQPAGSSTLRISTQQAKLRLQRADSALDRFLLNDPLVSKSMFFGLTQTLPSFLANAWLALLQSPAGTSQFVTEPDTVSTATDELLRYAGIVHTLHRKAATDIRIGDTAVLTGQQVILRVASANFDPENFEHPERLDLSRKSAGNLGLGTGPHACVGNVLVRLATASVTPVFLAARPTLDPTPRLRWVTDSKLSWPSSFVVRLD